MTLHRTFLRPDGSGKAEMRSPRKLMPGTVPEGSAIRLGPVGAVLGIAEGIETALAASMMFEMPVWSAIRHGDDDLLEPAGGRLRSLSSSATATRSMVVRRQPTPWRSG